MKKLLVSFSLVLTAGLASAFTQEINNDPRVEKLFAREFAGAENVKWAKLAEGGYQKASFTLAGTGVEAYFSVDAELLGTVRNIFYSQVPLVVMQTINKQFANAVIIAITEITNSEGTSYKIILEEKNKKYNLRLSSFGEITELRKIKTKK
jgi:hypothetical protein